MTGAIRTIAAINVAVVLAMASAAPAGAVAGYGDVDDGKWYTNPVQWTVDNDITGIEGACFKPDSPASRGETAFYMWNMQGRPTPRTEHPFEDVTISAQDPAISWMAETGITTGTTPTTFSPDDTLTRGQAAAFLHRLDGKPDATPHRFNDVTATWQQAPVSWMAETGITTGTTPTTFSPDDTLTRAHLATFLYRYKNKPAVTINTHSPPCTRRHRHRRRLRAFVRYPQQQDRRLLGRRRRRTGVAAVR